MSDSGRVRVYAKALTGGKLTRTDFAMTEDQCREIRAALQLRKDDPRLLRFIQLAEAAIGSYRIVEQQHRQLQTSARQRTVTAALANKARQLLEGMDELDEYRACLLNHTLGMRKEVPTQRDPGAGIIAVENQFLRQKTELQYLIDALDAMTMVLLKETKRGVSPKKDRKMLINALVMAYVDSFGAPPVTTRDAPFENAVRACLDAAGCPFEEVHKEITSAVGHVKGGKTPG